MPLEFNMWTNPWIGVERGDGAGPPTSLSIQDALLEAHCLHSLYDSSPLVVASIQRLLTAVLQAALNPQNLGDLRRIWQAGRFPDAAIRAFGEQFAARFDLFSVDAPFLQSADLPLTPEKGDKTVVYLYPETPAGGTHFWHGQERLLAFCPACAARGLVCMPAFTTAGGRGLKPSINGVPPLYILPLGENLFQSLAASLLRPAYQPPMRSETDRPWWQRAPIVEASSETSQVGYLHSLTFPARRVRLKPERLEAACIRCGQRAEWLVRAMVFTMGESRPKDTLPWQDPFAAYSLRDRPIPLRPLGGKALWREYAALFLQEARSSAKTLRPTVLDQIAELSDVIDLPHLSLRCIGMRTDMKAKVFEWVDAGFDAPPELLRDESASPLVRSALEFAENCDSAIKCVFKQHFGGKSKKSERHLASKKRISQAYWGALATHFRSFVLQAADRGQRTQATRVWVEACLLEARRTLESALNQMGDDAESLRRRVEAERHANIRLMKLRKEMLND